jgi:hypothetical protein
VVATFQRRDLDVLQASGRRVITGEDDVNVVVAVLRLAVVASFRRVV